MILRFGVSNYRSIKDYQEISFTAASITDEPRFTISSPKIKEPILPVVGIYGANASGKSNILLAFRFMLSGIISSHSQGTASGGIKRSPFKLVEGCAKEPTKFDCDFVIGGVRHTYGYAVDDDRVVEEWLFAYPSNRRQIWFHRNAEEETEFYFSDKFLRGKNKIIESLTRSNSLFLSAAAQNNHEILTPIYEYFENNFEFRLHQRTASESSVPKYFNDSDIRKGVFEFLTFADTGISDMKISEKEAPEEIKPFLVEIKEVIRKYVDSEKVDSEIVLNGFGEKTKFMKLGHSINGKGPVFLELREESKGTLALLFMLGPVFYALKHGLTIVVDELDTSVHTLLSRKILGLFTSQESNPCNAQLIFTTHDTNLLCGKSLRRDEIWFTEKDKVGATHIYPLTDMDTRKADNLEKGYLQGRFGAVPFLGNLDSVSNDNRVCK